MTCTSCAYQFVFDPKRDRLQGRRLTDSYIQSILYAASVGNTCVYTRNQLYLFACSRQRYRWRNLQGTFAVFNLLRRLLGTRRRLARRSWDDCLGRWEQAGKILPGLLHGPTLQQPPPNWDEPDIYDYGALGVLVCQHDPLVDWFVLNKLPAELKLVVLSERGYPSYLLPIVTRLLQTHSNLPLYLLHDGSSHGQNMLARLSVRDQLPLEGHPVCRLGIDLADIDDLPGRSLLPTDQSLERQAVDTIPYRSLVDLMAAAIASTPPQTLAAIWRARQTSRDDYEYLIEVSDFG